MGRRASASDARAPGAGMCPRGEERALRERASYLGVPKEEAIPYADLSQRLRRRAVTLRSDGARLCLRYRMILRGEGRATASEASEVDDELRYLCRVLAQA